MTCGPISTFKIFTGDAKTMPLKAVYAESYDPLDLTSCTEIDVALPMANGTYTHLTLTSGKVSIVPSALLGKFTAVITSLVSAGLNVGELQDVDVVFTISGVIQTVRFSQALTVEER